MNDSENQSNPLHKMFEIVRRRMIDELYNGTLDYDQAIKSLIHYRNAAEKLDDFEYIGKIYNTAAIIELHLSNFAKAEEYYTQALEAYQKSDNPERVANALCGMGELYREVGDTERAHECYSQSRQIAIENHNDRLVLFNNCNEGQLWLGVGELDKAIDFLSRALNAVSNKAWKTEFRNQLMPEVLAALGQAYAQMGNYEMALRQTKRALELAVPSNQLRQIAHAYQTFAFIAVKQDEDPTVIEDYYAQSLEHWLKLGGVSNAANLLAEEADYWLDQNNIERANEKFEMAANYMEKVNLLEEAETLRQRIARA